MKEGDEPLISSSQAPTAVGAFARALASAGLAAVLLSACATSSPGGGGSSAASPPAPTAMATAAPALAPTEIATTAAAGGPEVAETPTETIEALALEIVVHAVDLPESALSDELAFWDDPASPGSKMIGIPNTGDELDPPPENDPAVTFEVEVQEGVAYRCWIHMKVGAPMGVSQANVFWAQFSDAVDEGGNELYKPGGGSYLTAQGPEEEGWAWVACDPAESASDPLVRFRTSGPITVRMQAGMEGVGFDQFLLSPARYLENAPSEAVVEK
jgi:hypothetical protein